MIPATQKIWKPNSRQEDFLQLPDSIFEAMYGGAAGGGKSEALLMLPISRRFYQHSKFKGLLLRRTFPELEKEVIHRSRDWYPHAGGKYNESKQRWTFPSGAIMQFGHVEYDADARKYDSAEYNYVAFDELTSFTEHQYTYIGFTRCRTSTKELPAIVRSGTNPGNIGHGWVRDRFVEAAPYGTIIKDKTTGSKRIFIPAKATDNPHIDPGYIDRLSMLGEAERAAKRDGDWYTFAGQVFDEYRETPYPDEPPNAVHVVPAFEIPVWWPRILAIDWGYAAMTCALAGAVSPDRRLYIYDEYTCTQTKISTWATEIGAKFRHPSLKVTVLCKSAWQNRGDEILMADQFEKHSGIRPSQPDNDRISGKLLLQEYIRWKPKPDRKVLATDYSADIAQEILRKHGLDAYKEYLSSFEPSKPETNLPRLQIFEHCLAVRKAIPLCVYDEKRKEDVAEFVGDDPYDTVRYLVKTADHYMRESREADYHDKLAKVSQEFELSRDYTALSMKIGNIRKPVRSPVRRFGRSRVA